MNRFYLEPNFQQVRYGLHQRFVEEYDAEFILSLRTDLKLSRFIHSTDNDIEKQRLWIREYKNREREGRDYYFIYDFNGENIGVNRIYNMKDSGESCTGGSWVCKPHPNPGLAIATILCSRDTMFELLGFQKELFDVRKANVQVLRLHKMMGARIVGETELDYLLELNSGDYYEHKKRIVKLLNL